MRVLAGCGAFVFVFTALAAPAPATLARFLQSQPFVFAAFTIDDVRRAASALPASASRNLSNRQ